MRVLAERQWGVVDRAQLLALGFGRGEVETMRGRGELVDIHPGVYALGHGALTIRGRLWAGLRYAGAGSFLSHHTGAADRGLGRHRPEIAITTPSGHSPGRVGGLRIHRTTISVDATQARLHGGLLVATVPRIVVDLARTERPGEIERLITMSIRTGQFDLDALRRALDEHPHRPGVGLARAALRRYLPGGEERRSQLEASFQRHQHADPRLPDPVYNDRLLGYEIDVHWPDRRVVLELDGRPYHVAAADFDRDRAKDRTLIRHGWRPVRISDLEWEHDRALVLDDLYAVLGT